MEWIGEIPVEWNCSKIKHHFKIGSGTTPKSDIPSYWDGDIVWITPADFKTDDVYVSEGHRNLTQEGFESSTLEIIPAGNIIFSKRAPIGQVVINSVDLCTNQGCLTAVPLDKSNVKYYRYAMSAATNQFELAGSGTTFKEISATAFGNFILPSPDVSEQKRITEYLDRKCSSIDSVIMKQQVIIEKLKEYKLSIITEKVSNGLNPCVSTKYSGNEFIGSIPSHWKCVKIKNVSIVVTDGAHVSPETENGVYDFISTVNVEQDHIDFDNCLKTTESSYQYLVSTGCRPLSGDVLISKDGSVGRTVIVNTDRDFVVSSSLVIIRPNIEMITSEYLNFILRKR